MHYVCVQLRLVSAVSVNSGGGLGFEYVLVVAVLVKYGICDRANMNPPRSLKK
jgi:hypothetical protein